MKTIRHYVSQTPSEVLIDPAPQKSRILPARTALPRLNHWDWLFALAFLAFAVVYFLGRLQGNYPIVILTGDGGNIASYAAAQDHPDWFTG